MNEEAQNALAELERMKAEMAAKLAAVSQMMKQMKDAQKPEEKPSEPAPESEQTAPAPEAHNAPQTDPEKTDNKPENEPETEAELEPDEDEQTAEPDGEDAPPDPAEPEDNKAGEDKTDEKPPKWEWKATNQTEERLKAYFDANASESLKGRVKNKKTIQGAMKHLTEWARKLAKGAGCYCATDEDTYCELMHYFEEDSLNCEWKPTPKPAPYKPAKPYTPPVIPKPAPKKPDPQMTLFDF